MYMQGLANFIDDFLGGLMLISYALVVGSVLWGFVILRVTGAERAGEGAIVASLRVLHFGAVALAASVGVKLVVKGAVLASTLGELPMGAYAGTVQFQAGLLRLLLALALMWFAKRAINEPGNPGHWQAIAGLTVPLVISG
ncbi:MAG: copper resistance protein, partial [Candidatus Methylumidiphilus sp.]